MIIKDKFYYENFKQDIVLAQKDVDYYIRQANRMKTIYLVTKDVRGYGWLNKFAKGMNNRYVRKGTKIAMEALNKCNEEIIFLEKYISSID